LSQDKFWEQWGGAPAQPADKPAETENPEAEKKDAGGGVDTDVLSAWLQALPPNDPVVPPVPPVTEKPASAPAPGDLAALWPPQAPVDPFAGMSSNAPASDWDLAFDDDVVPAIPPADAPASTLTAPDVTGPVPQANPFAPEAAAPEPVEAAAPTPVVSPFGPPPPPAAPPQEVLEAAPLKLVITTGRRTNEQSIQGEALIGRPDATRGIHPEIDLRLDDAVSRRHAKIYVRNGEYVLTDLNSTNGTRHNRQWLQPEVEVPLKAGDEIEIGEITLIRVLEAPEPNA
jgi:hypothetical protein